MLRLLGDFVPHTPTGTPPLDPAGELPSPRPLPPLQESLAPLWPPQLWQSGAATATHHHTQVGRLCEKGNRFYSTLV